MLFVLSVTVMLASESVRGFLEDLFARFSVTLAEYPFECAVVVAVLSVLCLLKWGMWGTRRREDGRELPPEIPSLWPFFGNFVEFAKSPVGTVWKGYKTLGEYFTITMFGQKITLLIGPEAHASFFKATDEELSQPEVYHFMTPVFGEGVVYDASPKRRAQQMQLMATGLRTSRMKTYVSKIRQETEQYFASWGEKGEVDLREAMAELTILTAARALMGDEVREDLFAEVSRIYAELDNGCTPLSFFFPYAPTAAHRRRDKARREMVELFSKVIRRRRERQRATGEKKEDILQTFMDAEYKDQPGQNIPDEHVVGLLIALLFAGQHTSSITSTWCILELLRAPQALAKVQQEVAAALKEKKRKKEQEEEENREKKKESGEGDGSSSASASTLSTEQLGYEDLQSLTFLHHCVRETLRLHPPLILLMRKVLRDRPLPKNRVLPAGHIAAVSPAVAGRLPSVFARPDAFDPDRFARGEDKPQFSYVGFGGGMHACMGQQYAYLQLKTILCAIFREFELQPVSDFPEHDYAAMVVGPKGKCVVRYRRLTQQEKVKAGL